MIRYFSSSFQRVTTGYQRVSNALPCYSTQFLQYSTHDRFLCNIRCITVHVTKHFERNKYIIVPFSTRYYALPSIFLKKIIVYFFFKNVVVTGKWYKYLLVPFKMYGKIHSKVSGYVVKILMC